MLDKGAVRNAVIVLFFALMVGCSGQTLQEPAPKPADPALALALAQKGAQAYEQGRRRAAEEAWMQAVELNPADPVVVNNLALLLKENQRFSEAVVLLERGLGYSPDVAELHYNLAVISELYLLDLEKALIHYQQYRHLSGAEDKAVAGWIADLERRLD